MTRNLEPDYKKAIVGLYLKRLHLAKTSELVDFQFGTTESAPLTVKVSRIALPVRDNNSIFFCGSLGFIQNTKLPIEPQQFISIVDSSEICFAELVAVTFHYHYCISKLDYGNTFPLGEHSELRLRGYSSAIILDAGVYSPFENINSESISRTLNINFSSVIPISSNELEVKRTTGLDGLLSLWDKDGRDILTVNSVQNRTISS